MIIEDTGLKGLKLELADLDYAAEKTGFFRGQWEYYRATYDFKIDDKATNDEYYVRFNTKVIEGKLEAPDTLLEVEDAYLGIATYPLGLDYNSPIPDHIANKARQILAELKRKLA